MSHWRARWVERGVIASGRPTRGCECGQAIGGSPISTVSDVTVCLLSNVALNTGHAIEQGGISGHFTKVKRGARSGSVRAPGRRCRVPVVAMSRPPAGRRDGGSVAYRLVEVQTAAVVSTHSPARRYVIPLSAQRKGSRADGTNPRALGTNPRATGVTATPKVCPVCDRRMFASPCAFCAGRCGAKTMAGGACSFPMEGCPVARHSVYREYSETQLFELRQSKRDTRSRVELRGRSYSG